MSREVRDNPVRGPYDWDMENHGSVTPNTGRKDRAGRSRPAASAATRRLPAGLTR
jgi:hypothetical protein